MDSSFYQCAICKQQSQSIEDLKIHVKTHQITVKNEENFECLFCGSNFSSETILKFHKKSHFGVMSDGNEGSFASTMIYKCEFCLKSFSKAKDKAIHLRIHENIKIYECQECVLSFRIQESYLNHVETVHNFKMKESESSRKFPCHLCSLSFIRISTLEMHIKRNHINQQLPTKSDPPVELTNIRNKFTPGRSSPRLYQCSSCGLKLTHPETLENHVKIHLKTKHSCDICKLSFLKEESLKKHKEKHSEANYTCGICKIPYKFEKDLNFHNRLHAEKGLVYTCVYCYKKFLSTTDKINHERSHTKEKIYKCSFAECDKTFSYLTSLKKHNLTHTGIKDFICFYCGLQFSSKCNLSNHIKFHLNVRKFACYVCKKKFLTSSHLKSHEKLHYNQKDYKCTTCEKKFIHFSSFYKHKKSHEGIKNHECSVCSRKFLQKVHLTQHVIQVHQSVKNFHCLECKKRFKRKSVLKNHMKTHEKKKNVLKQDL